MLLALVSDSVLGGIAVVVVMVALILIIVWPVRTDPPPKPRPTKKWDSGEEDDRG